MSNTATKEIIIYVWAPNDRPDFRLVSTFLWDDDRNVNTDGNSYNPASRTWTQLYICNRENPKEEVDVYPEQDKPLILRVRSQLDYLAVRVAYFLAHHTNGKVSTELDDSFHAPDILKSKMGAGFSVEAALERVKKSRYANTTLKNPYPWLQDS